jgi:hypothetical protein
MTNPELSTEAESAIKSTVAMNTTSRITLCLSIIAVCGMVIGCIDTISFNDLYFAHPSKLEEGTSRPSHYLPAISNYYYRYYHLSWIIFAGVAAWGGFLAFRSKATLTDVAVFAAVAFCFTTWFVLSAVLARYFANTTFVLNMQHLRPK